LRAIGRRTKKDDVAFHEAKCNEAVVKELIGEKKPHLSSLPSGTKWLVVHGQHSLSNASASEDNVGVRVSCCRDTGATLPSLGPGLANFLDRMADHTVVQDWISKCGHSGHLTVAKNSNFQGWQSEFESVVTLSLHAANAQPGNCSHNAANCPVNFQTCRQLIS